MKAQNLFFLVISIWLLASCEKGKLSEEKTQTTTKVLSQSLIDYNASDFSLEVEVRLDSATFRDLEEIHFYNESSCEGEPVATKVVKEINAGKIQIPLPQRQNQSIYYRSNAQVECRLLVNVEAPNLKPSDPVFDHTVPTSPSRDTLSPGIFGQAFPPSGQILFYKDALCSDKIGEGLVQNFIDSGLPVQVQENEVTRIYAYVEDLLGQKSSCVDLSAFEHSNSLSPAPLLESITPSSPSKSSLNPFVRGSTSVDAVSIALYSDSACLSLLVEGLPTEFQQGGLQIQGLANATVQIYAKSINDNNEPSICTRLGDFTHDNIAPVNPSYTSVSPTSPTNQTLSPKLKGMASVDTETIQFYKDAFCVSSIGQGTRQEFITTGVSAGVSENTTTDIYAKAFDKAGNGSGCVSFISYVHNTYAPDAPLFQTFDPPSPTNQSTTPRIKGQPSTRTVALNFFKDEVCQQSIGSGTASDFENAGIQLTAEANTNTDVYVQVSDIEGNISGCFSLASFEHSNQPSPPPTFLLTSPASPSKSSNSPYIVGQADGSIESVSLYSDATCTSFLGSDTRGRFTSSGIGVTLPLNSTNEIYAQATDIFGNLSSCVFLTHYIHNTVKPVNPTYLATNPLSPNNSSITPLITGTSYQDPASQLPPVVVRFYDSPSCVSKVGEGSPNEFETTGVQLSLPENIESYVYGRAFDEAGNRSDCTFLTTYYHNNLRPADPIFISSSPGSPTYSPDIRVFGSYAGSPDQMQRVDLRFYSDPTCTTLVTSGDPALLDTTGFPISLAENTTTSFYAQSVNEVGTLSNCVAMTTMRHYDEALSNLTLQNRNDGSLYLTWNSDSVSRPSPKYNVERAVRSGGPYAVVSSEQTGTVFRDYKVTKGTNYFYRVYANNSTGQSQYSTEVQGLVSPDPVSTVANLNARGSYLQIVLTWSGFPENMEYKLYRSENYAGPFEEHLTTTTTTSFVDTNVIPNKDYYYVLKASNPEGLSLQSNTAYAVTKDVPPAPQKLGIELERNSLDCSGGRAVKVTWLDSAYYDTYELYGGAYKSSLDLIETVNNNATLLCHQGGFRYFKVRAKWGASYSNRSNVVGFYATDTVRLTHVNPGNNEVLLSWSGPSSLPYEIQGLTVLYSIYVSEHPDRDFSPLLENTTTSTLSHALASGEGRYYYVQAHAVDGLGDKILIGYPSEVVGVRTEADPGAPANLVAVRGLSDRADIFWTSPTHYNAFQVYKATNPAGPFSPYTYTESEFVLGLNLDEGLNYFRVTSRWGDFESAPSNTVSFRHAPINNFSATSSATEITLTWDAVSGVQDYVLYRSTEKNGTYSTLGVLTQNTYVDTSVVLSEGYYYKLKARFTDNTEGEMSEVVAQALTGSNVPRGLSLTLLNATFGELNWIGQGNDVYEVLIAQSLSGPFSLKGTVIGNSLNLAGLFPGQEYFVKVIAHKGAQTYESGVLSFETLFPTNPPNLVAGDNQVEVSWNFATGANNYDVLRSSDGESYSSVVASYSGTSYVDTTALNGQIYFYKIRSNFNSKSLDSAMSFAVTPGLVPQTPLALRGQNVGNGSSVDLSWTSSPGVNRYNIYQSTTSGSYGAPVQSASSSRRVRVSGLTSGTKYYFQVKALKGNVESAFSNEFAITPIVEPLAPEVFFYNATSLTVNLASLGGAATYDLYRSTEGGRYIQIASGLTSLTYNDSGLDAAGSYTYKYLLRDASGAGIAMSASSRPATLNVDPETPTDLHINIVSQTNIELFWSKVPSVTGYEVLRSTSSGGGYVSLGTVTNPYYNDGSVANGQSYFYVVRSINRSQKKSAYSPERAAYIFAGPSSLSLMDNAGEIQVSWPSVAGALSYNVKRSEVSGGPYGLIQNTTATAFTDGDINALKDYYYVVTAVFSDNRESLSSAESHIQAQGFLDLVVPISLNEMGLSSVSHASLTFNRTYTVYNPDDFDGVDHITLEVLAQNTDNVNRSISLIDEAGVVVDSITVPANTLEMTRVSQNVSLKPNEEGYRMALDQTSVDGQLVVKESYLNIYQINASKTKVYYRLLSANQSPSHLDLDAPVSSVYSDSYQEVADALYFKREVQKLDEVEDYNAWTLEALVAASGDVQGSLVLKNRDQNQILEVSEARFSGSNILLAEIEIDEGSPYFASANENNFYSLSLKCKLHCSSGEAKLYKAHLTVKLRHLSKALITKRISGFKDSVSSEQTFYEDRAYYNVANYTNPEVSYSVQAQDDMSSSANAEIYVHNQDSGNLGLSFVSGTLINMNSDLNQVYETSEVTGQVEGRYVLKVSPQSGSVNIIESQIKIYTKK